MAERTRGTDALTAALLFGKTEIRTRGYRPVPFRNWKVDDEQAIAIVGFGPYDELTTYDCYAIFEGDQPMIAIPEECTVSLPRGFSFDWQLSFTRSPRP